MVDLNLKGALPFKYSKGSLGGTFDVFHEGHRRLIRLAAEMCSELLIGVTSDEFSLRTKMHDVEPFERRLRNVASFVGLLSASNRTKIVKIDDPFGPTVTDRELRALFVTADTIENGFKINDERRKAGLNPVEIIIVPRVMAESGGFISSTRIRAGEIDPEGKAISPKASST